MTTDTLTLPQFLEQCIAADEATARAATPGPWEVGDWWHIQGASHCRCDAGPLVWAGVRDINGTRMPAHVHRRREPIGGDIMQADASGGEPANVSFGSDFGPGIEDVDAAHVIRHDPARVLAQCEALRAVVERQVEYAQVQHRNPADCPDLRALAQIWRDHEAFDPSWGAS